MNYIEFKIRKKRFSLCLKDAKITPTFINKTIKKNGYEYINYKGREIKVFDIAPLNNLPKLKKFDGLILIRYHNEFIGIKSEGFYKFSPYLRFTPINIDNIFSDFLQV